MSVAIFFLATQTQHVDRVARDPRFDPVDVLQDDSHATGGQESSPLPPLPQIGFRRTRLQLWPRRLHLSAQGLQEPKLGMVRGHQLRQPRSDEGRSSYLVGPQDRCRTPSSLHDLHPLGDHSAQQHRHTAGGAGVDDHPIQLGRDVSVGSLQLPSQVDGGSAWSGARAVVGKAEAHVQQGLLNRYPTSTA